MSPIKSFFFIQHVVDMMLRMRRELSGQEPQITPQIDNLLILDRNVDLLTPLLSQLTYEGLIDEIFDISNSKLEMFCIIRMFFYILWFRFYGV